jgi:phosphoribosylformimino-5-aminoimidazole carboxamide ribotide isomerase
MEESGVQSMIFTDISTDGTLAGPNLEQLAALSQAVCCNLIASGGIRDVSHIEQLRQAGLYGAICGKSIYKGTLDLKEAIAASGGIMLANDYFLLGRQGRPGVQGRQLCRH